jgi:uncharacterized LabA/DUF88 family protein
VVIAPEAGSHRVLSIYPTEHTMFGKTEKVAIFIDGANLWHTCREISLNIDFVRFIKYFVKSQVYLVSASYYTGVDSMPDGHQSIRKLLDFLSQNGFRLVEKPARVFRNDAGDRTVKGNVDVEICCDVLTIADGLDRIVLVSGDGDFTALVKAVQLKCKRVTVVSATPLIASILKKAADEFVDLRDPQVQKSIARESAT